MKKIVHTLTILLSIALSANAQTQFINDPSFESGNLTTPSLIWNDIFLTDSSGCIVGGPSFGHTGDKCLAMIIEPNKESGGSANQPFVVTNPALLYNATLEFYIKNSLFSAASTDLFIIAVDGSGVSETSYITTGLASDANSIGTNWKKVSIKIDSLGTTNALQIVWGNNILGAPFPTPDYSIYYLDDITITSGYPTAITNPTCTQNCYLSITPTIATSTITVNRIDDNTGNQSAEIYNSLGQKVLTQNVNSANNKVNVEALNTGIYFVKVKNSKGETILNSKIVKQ
jgi:hypothetical protein